MAVTKIKIPQITDGTAGRLITWDAGGSPTTVATGTSGQVLTSNGVGAAPTFQAVAGGGASSGISGAVQFSDGAGGFLSDATNFFFNNSTNRLELAGSSGYGLSITGSGTGGITNSAASTITGNYNSFLSQTSATGLLSIFSLNTNTSNAAAHSRISVGTSIGGGDPYFHAFNNEVEYVMGYDLSATKFYIGQGTNPSTMTYTNITLESERTGILQTSPTAYLHTGAGTTSMAPFKFTSGTNLTTPEAGAMEWDGTRLYVTQTSGPTRKTIAYTSDITGDILNGGNTTGAAITIGTNDEYGLNLETNGITRISITGNTTTGGKTTITETTATTNDIEHALTISSNSTGTGAVGFGTGMYFRQKSTSVNDQFAATITTPWTTATNVFRTADLVIKTTYQGILGEGLRVVSDANPLVRIQSKLQFAGATSSFPMLKQSSAILQAKLADDSAYTDLEVADEAYGVGWNGSLEVPTKNAIYDKIQTLGGTLSDADYGDITVSGIGTIMTIDNSVVTLAKIANAGANSKLLGSGSAGSGSAYSEITLGSDLTMTSTTLSVTQATTSLAGKVKLATTFETTNGTDTDIAVTPRGLSASIYGTKCLAILVSDPNGDALTTGDGKAYFRIDDYVTGMNLVGVGASVSTVSSSGAPTVQIRRVRSGTPVDMLSTALTIDTSERDSSTAAVAAVINTSNDDTLTGDQIYIDIDVAGTGTKGLCVTLNFQTP
jgi:hypothetical protein